MRVSYFNLGFSSFPSRTLTNPSPPWPPTVAQTYPPSAKPQATHFPLPSSVACNSILHSSTRLTSPLRTLLRVRPRRIWSLQINFNFKSTYICISFSCKMKSISSHRNKTEHYFNFFAPFDFVKPLIWKSTLCDRALRSCSHHTRYLSYSHLISRFSRFGKKCEI